MAKKSSGTKSNASQKSVKKSSVKSSVRDEETTFEESLRSLEETVAKLENGSLDLEGSLSAYEMAMKQLRFCYEKLSHAQRRVELLKDLEEDGTVISEEYDDREEELGEKQKSRARRRSS